MARVCALCAAPATLFCAQDDAMLCASCSTQIHSANAVVSRHKVVPISELPAQQDAQSEARSAPFHAKTAPADTEPASTSEMQLVPVIGESSNTAGGEPSKQGGSVLGGPQGWAMDFDLFDLDNGWLDKLDGFDGFDLPLVEEDQLVPTVSESAAQRLDDVLNPFKQQLQHAAVPQASAAAARRPSAVRQPEASNDEAMMVPSFPTHPFLISSSAAAEEQQQDSLQQQHSVPSLPTPVFSAPAPASEPSRPAPTATVTFQLPAAVARVSPEQAAINRAERLSLYRERKKTRKFEKTIRYASRKAYAEVRPRIKGRFATPAEVAEMKAAAEREAKAKAAAASAFVMDEDDAVVPCF